MRKAPLILLVLSALAVPAIALGVSGAKGDGTLSVKDGYGRVTLTGKGTVFGRVDSGRIVYTNLDLVDDSEPDFFDTCERTKLLLDGSTSCNGTQLRFRLLGASKFKLTIVGREIDLSAVGRGQAVLEGSDTAFDTGDYTVNGGVAKGLPVDPVTISFGQTSAPPPSGP